MAFKYVIAILQPEVIPALEAQLSRIGVGGITLTRVKGFGGYKNFFSRDWLTDHAMAELFVEDARVGALLPQPCHLALGRKHLPPEGKHLARSGLAPRLPGSDAWKPGFHRARFGVIRSALDRGILCRRCLVRLSYALLLRRE